MLSYRPYKLPFSLLNKRWLAVLILLAVCATGCISDFTALNSERIARKFGSYGLEVIENTNNIRVSNLYSKEPAGAVCRTFAVVRLTDKIEAAFEAEHALVSSGKSIGAVFRSHGWDIEKRHEYIGNIAIDNESKRVAKLMRIDPPASAAIHVYVFAITKNGSSFDYARIAEIHHPEYLTSAQLRSIYGSEYSGGEQQDEVRQVLVLVSRKFRDSTP